MRLVITDYSLLELELELDAFSHSLMGGRWLPSVYYHRSFFSDDDGGI